MRSMKPLGRPPPRPPYPTSTMTTTTSTCAPVPRSSMSLLSLAMPGQVMPSAAGPPPVPYDPATYGMAGVGVQRARSRRDGPEQPEPQPYNRFASPPIPETYQDQMGMGPARYRGGNNTPHDWDILQAAGLSGADPYAAVNANLMRGPSSSQGHSVTAGSTSLNRQPSLGASGLLSTPSNPTPPTSQESYASHYKPNSSPPLPNPNASSALDGFGHAPVDNRKSMASAMEDPYGGIEEAQPNSHALAIPNPFENTDESEEGHGLRSLPPGYDAGDAASGLSIYLRIQGIRSRKCFMLSISSIIAWLSCIELF
ncbi:hypothetical protein NEOLEDRAFT_150316 [Neolentinus lepideus HHB14362 ss-1]|uniref:Uncharacterized protein n=1 Tax=Neolentinus lepideus HHB14362 ss-1 TaxID=1314782 RepID=A0A165MMM5_9AGAM|nr:hypothetical protein NEOLEDRAFT_150316 [Neolentinus lepideus HHB14362 ss-1]